MDVLHRRADPVVSVHPLGPRHAAGLSHAVAGGNAYRSCAARTAGRRVRSSRGGSPTWRWRRCCCRSASGCSATRTTAPAAATSAVPSMIATAFGPLIGGIATPAGTAANLVAIASRPACRNVEISFTQWMVYGVPAALLMVPLAWRLLLWLFPPELRAAADSPRTPCARSWPGSGHRPLPNGARSSSSAR